MLLGEPAKRIEHRTEDHGPDDHPLHRDRARLGRRDRRDLPRGHAVGCLRVRAEDLGGGVVTGGLNDPDRFTLRVIQTWLDRKIFEEVRSRRALGYSDARILIAGSQQILKEMRQ